MAAAADTPVAHRPVVVWLWCVYAAIAATMLIGGITRLTGSGLSMVEWQPLFGALPPLSQDAWLDVFGKYQQFPQYIQVNSWMTLADFKRIFFWEYLHRLSGRAIGIVFLLPFLWFALHGRVRGQAAHRIGVAFALGGAQGLLGWFMVKSGLADLPTVSHYRLSAHLALAMLIAVYLVWQIRWLTGPRPRAPQPRGARSLLLTLLALLVLQIVYGAWMAGTRAGHIFPDFPTMGGHWWPQGVPAGSGFWVDITANPVAIHAIHRWLGYVLAVVAVAYTRRSLRDALPARRMLGAAIGATMLLQVGLGAATVVGRVATVPAVAHQGVGFALLTLAVWALYDLPRTPDPTARAERQPAVTGTA